MSEPAVLLERNGAVARVTLSREAKLNALTSVMLGELENAARALDADPDVRVVVLTGAGERSFCVGADIHEWSSLAPLDMWRHWVRHGHRVFDQWARLRQPVICAINGHAFGGGLELALTADIRLACAHAQFALPEATIGTCPGWSGTQRLVHLIGASRAKYLALSGRRLDAAAMQAAGLVHEVMPGADLLERADEFARQLCMRAPVALQLTKQLVNAASNEDPAATLEAMAGAVAAATQDGAEGIRSFCEKRAPLFTGR